MARGAVTARRQVVHHSPTVTWSIEEWWGPGFGDARTFSVSRTGKRVRISDGKSALDVSADVAEQVAHALRSMLDDYPPTHPPSDEPRAVSPDVEPGQ